jgi:hypothetical protein
VMERAERGHLVAKLELGDRRHHDGAALEHRAARRAQPALPEQG